MLHCSRFGIYSRRQARPLPDLVEAPGRALGLAAFRRFLPVGGVRKRLFADSPDQIGDCRITTTGRASGAGGVSSLQPETIVAIKGLR
jgi:hypothetical protein